MHVGESGPGDEPCLRVAAHPLRLRADLHCLELVVVWVDALRRYVNFKKGNSCLAKAAFFLIQGDSSLRKPCEDFLKASVMFFQRMAKNQAIINHADLAFQTFPHC